MKILPVALAAAVAVWAATLPHRAPVRGADAPPKKIVLIAGKKSHGPNTHEYEKGVRLLKHCLDNSPNVRGVEAVVVTDGWPEDARVLDEAATILLFSDGSDIEATLHPLLNGNRMEVFSCQMKRGCG
jgi:hypothetical protein